MKRKLLFIFFFKKNYFLLEKKFGIHYLIYESLKPADI